MLAKRIIPCLDVDKGRVVKGVKFLSLRDAGDPVAVARRYETEGADELVFLDITASHEARDILVNVVKATAEQIFMPLTVGGGIRSIEDCRTILNAGADKVSLNSSAVKTPELITASSKRFGAQCTVVAIDVKRIIEHGQEVWRVFVNGGRIPTEHQAVAQAVSIPVIASGGAGNPEHLREVLTDGKADAALAAGIFHFGTYTIGQTKDYLLANGVTVRPARVSGEKVGADAK